MSFENIEEIPKKKAEAGDADMEIKKILMTQGNLIKFEDYHPDENIVDQNVSENDLSIPDGGSMIEKNTNDKSPNKSTGRKENVPEVE